MAVIESGLIVNGMPIIRSEYYPANYNVDPFLRTGLFTAIQTFASKAFSDQPEEMRLKKYILLVKDFKINDSTGQQLLYVIVEKGTDLGEVRKRLANLRKKLDLSDIIFDAPVMTQQLKEVRDTIDRELNDLCLKPADRAKKIFG
jgi:hypothetical protein